MPNTHSTRARSKRINFEKVYSFFLLLFFLSLSAVVHFYWNFDDVVIPDFFFSYSFDGLPSLLRIFFYIRFLKVSHSPANSVVMHFGWAENINEICSFVCHRFAIDDHHRIWLSSNGRWEIDMYNQQTIKRCFLFKVKQTETITI